MDFSKLLFENHSEDTKYHIEESKYVSLLPGET